MREIQRMSDLHIGDYVIDIEDERHVGRVTGITWPRFAKIEWVETGWKSYGVPLTNLRVVDYVPERPLNSLQQMKLRLINGGKK